jgi:hypothetical protein
MGDIYRNRDNPSHKVRARKIGKFMQSVSIVSGITHGNVGDYIVRNLSNGEISFMRGQLFEVEFERAYV